MIRLVVEPRQCAGELVHLTVAQARYLTQVMRRRPGDGVVALVSGQARCAVVVDRNTLELAGAVALAPAPLVAISLVQALLKGDQMAGVVERATEAGADAVLPVVAARSIARSASADRVSRWRKVAQKATEQSGRAHVPTIGEPTALASWVPSAPAIALVPEQEPLPAVWRRLGHPARVHLVVGPEGGLTASEIERCDAAAGLGPRVLRAENAGAFAVFWLLADAWQANPGGVKSC